MALVATLGLGTAEEDLQFATQLGEWVGPLGGALATFLVATWAVRPLTRSHVSYGALLGVFVALLDIAIIAAAGSPFQWLFVGSAVGRILAGALGGYFSGALGQNG